MTPEQQLREFIDRRVTEELQKIGREDARRIIDGPHSPCPPIPQSHETRLSRATICADAHLAKGRIP